MEGGDQRTIRAAERLADLCADVIGDGLRSVVLHGSLVVGGFRPGRSDLDLLLVVDEGLSDAQATALEAAVTTSDTENAVGIDLHVVTADVARAPTRNPALELHVGRYAGGVEVTRRVHDPDLLTELSMARADGRALLGAAPSEVIEPVPASWVVDRNRSWLERWRRLTDDKKNAAFMVLTACRMWRFAVEGVHSSKVAAAAWALDRDPSLHAVRQALQQYDADPDAQVDEDRIGALLDLVLAETARSH
jgi:hypothetical protein